MILALGGIYQFWELRLVCRVVECMYSVLIHIAISTECLIDVISLVIDLLKGFPSPYSYMP